MKVALRSTRREISSTGLVPGPRRDHAEMNMQLASLLPPVPEVDPSVLAVRARQLHDQEREALEALGVATLRGIPGAAARAELRRIREELDATYSAQRILERTGRARWGSR